MFDDVYDNPDTSSNDSLDYSSGVFQAQVDPTASYTDGLTTTIDDLFGDGSTTASSSAIFYDLYGNPVAVVGTGATVNASGSTSPIDATSTAPAAQSAGADTWVNSIGSFLTSLVHQTGNVLSAVNQGQQQVNQSAHPGMIQTTDSAGNVTWSYPASAIPVSQSSGLTLLVLAGMAYYALK